IAVGSGDAVGLPNSGNATTQLTIDLKLNRWFNVGTRRFDFSLQGTNIFDNRAVSEVDPYNGLGLAWGDGRYDPRLFSGFNQSTTTSRVGNPWNYGGSRWRLQLDVDL